MTTFMQSALDVSKFDRKPKAADYVRTKPNKTERIDIQVGDHSQWKGFC